MTRTINACPEHFLNSDQLRAALNIWRRSDTPAKEICEKVIKPELARINQRLRQENDPLYIAYLVEYWFNSTEKKS